MQFRTWTAGTSSFLVVGLLMLAGVLSDARPALAQTQDAEDTCRLSLPPGVTPPADPSVTAQQAEDGSASLQAFTLAVRERLTSRAEDEALYFACILRQEGGPYRSGSTYIVQLTLNGRVFVHSKDMSLSGGLLNPLVYAEVLSRLGVPPSVLANLASPDPTIAAGASAAVRATLSQQPHAPFDATTPIPGLRPGIPGASGYATAYASANLRVPRVLLAGFDLDASHLASEAIDYGNPTITARDVVDQETLKAFVTGAGEYFIGLFETGDSAVTSKARIALRDPNGPWRHGSVYLYVLDLDSNSILVHGANPDRYELRPLVATVRDVVTGKLVLEEVIKAAKSSPEGGFVEYYFDDPTDDTDSADIPKVGYARQFTGTGRRPNGAAFSRNFIIGSGFYRRSPEGVAADPNAVVESVLPQVMRAMTAGTVDAISGRIHQATTDAPPAAGFSFGGASTLSDAVLANARALESGTLDLGRLLAGSSLTLPLNAAGGGGSGSTGNLTLWASGDYRNLSGGNRQTLDYEGDVRSAHLGVDTRLSANLLAGMSVARAQGTVDYTDPDAATGEVTTSLTSIHPYVGWQTPGDLSLWATAGHGWGEVEVDDDSADAQASDLTQRMVAAGMSGPLIESEGDEGGTTSLRLKAEAAVTWADVDGSGSLRSTSLYVSRQRLMLEGSHVRELPSGATFTPSVELGVRNDGGDGETGGSVELGGGLRYADRMSGLTMEGRARTLLGGGGDYEEWGVSGLVRLDPGASGRGLSLSVQPAWGRTAGGVQRLWETGDILGASAADRASARMSAEIGYGLGAPRGLGVVTPYAGLGLSGEGTRSWRMGARWRVAPEASLGLEGTGREAANDDGPEHGLMLRGVLHW